MNPIENPLWLAVLSFVAAIAGQVGFALARRDLRSLRSLHHWIDDPSIRRLTAERDLGRISETCLPGALILVGGFPQALAISLSFTTLIVGLRGTWWCLLMVPLVYLGAEVLSGAGLRSFARSSLRRGTKTIVGEQDHPPSA